MRAFLVIGTLGMVAALAAPARAQYPGKGPAPTLHVDDAHDSCFFDLHPELTQAEFKEFSKELGSILRFRQMSDTTTLGKGKLDVSLQYSSTSIDDAKGAWNNTMSHPAADHWLGQSIPIPRLVARLGVSDRVDLGAWGSVNPQSNYGAVGVDAKIALLRQGPRWPVSVAIRPSVSSLVGPSEVWAASTSIDVSVSRAFGPLSPYVGFASTGTLAVERSKDVALDRAYGDDSLAYAGLAYRWRSLMVSAEVEKGALASWGLRIGRRF